MTSLSKQDEFCTGMETYIDWQVKDACLRTLRCNKEKNSFSVDV